MRLMRVFFLLAVLLFQQKAAHDLATGGLRHGSRAKNATSSVAAVVAAGAEKTENQKAAKAVSDATTEVVSSAQMRVRIAANTQLAADQLIHFMVQRSGAPNVEFEDFLPGCLAHVKKLIRMVDKTYSDQQLETVLRNECKGSEEFPLSRGESGFRHSESCHEFAKKLAEARNEELQTGSQTPYEEFCADFYQHHGGRLERTKKTEPESDNFISIPFAAITVLVCLALVGAAYYFLRNHA